MYQEWHGLHRIDTRDDVVTGFYQFEGLSGNVVVLAIDATTSARNRGDGYGVALDGELEVVWFKEEVADQDRGLVRLKCAVFAHGLRADGHVLRC